MTAHNRALSNNVHDSRKRAKKILIEHDTLLVYGALCVVSKTMTVFPLCITCTSI